MIFENQKVRRTRGEVHVDHGRQRPHRIVRRDHHIVRFRHARDLLQLEYPAGQADIGLHDVGRLLGQQLAEVELGV